MNPIMKEFKQKTTGAGLRVFLTTLLLLIALIGVNLLFGLLPASVTEPDISPLKMYSVSDTTKRELSKLNEKVEIYMLSAGGESVLADEGRHIKTFLEKFPDYNKNLSFKVIDTLIDPTFHSELGLSEAPENLSIIVKSGKRLRTLSSNDLFYYYIDGVGKIDAADIQQYVYMMQLYGQSVNPIYYFDGENKLLSALDYITTDILPIAYQLSGHNEIDLPDSFVTELEANNITLSTLGLIQTGEIPDDCSLLIIYAPEQDITADEKEILSNYLSDGGKLLLVTNPGVSALENLLAVTSEYGLVAEDGIVIENDSNHYYQYPYYLFPSVTAHSATGTLSSSKYILLTMAHGIKLGEKADDINTMGIFSSTAVSHIIPTDAETTARPEGQDASEHLIGAVAESDSGTKIVWIASPDFFGEGANSYTAGGNYAYALSAIKWICAKQDSIKISPLPMETSRLVVSAGSAAIWSVVLIFMIPLAVFGCGMLYWLRRRKK